MKEQEIKNLLGGYNCGGCGFFDCEECAKAILAKQAPADMCPMAEEENVEKIQAIVDEENKQARKNGIEKS